MNDRDDEAEAVVSALIGILAVVLLLAAIATLVESVHR
jgi:hypothetical protein